VQVPFGKPFGPFILSSEAAHLRSSNVARYELVAMLKKLKNNTMAISMAKNRSIGWPQQGFLSKMDGSRLEIARNNLGRGRVRLAFVRSPLPSLARTVMLKYVTGYHVDQSKS
jgi:hypothetical protein